MAIYLWRGSGHFSSYHCNMPRMIRQLNLSVAVHLARGIVERFGQIGGLSGFTFPPQDTRFYEGRGNDFTKPGALLFGRQINLLLVLVFHVASGGGSFSQK